MNSNLYQVAVIGAGFPMKFLKDPALGFQIR
jgi:hypothetical protein